MSRYQSNSKGKSRSNSEALFPLLILLGCFAYSHKILVLKIEHLLPVILVSTLGLMISVIVARSIFLFSGRIRIHPSKMSDIDRMTGLEFEKYVAGLLKKQGYENIRLTEEFDYGVDIIATKDKNGMSLRGRAKYLKISVIITIVLYVIQVIIDIVLITSGSYAEISTQQI